MCDVRRKCAPAYSSGWVSRDIDLVVHSRSGECAHTVERPCSAVNRECLVQ
jgi:hypothetical protein